MIFCWWCLLFPRVQCDKNNSLKYSRLLLKLNIILSHDITKYWLHLVWIFLIMVKRTHNIKLTPLTILTFLKYTVQFSRLTLSQSFSSAPSPLRQPRSFPLLYSHALCCKTPFIWSIVRWDRRQTKAGRRREARPTHWLRSPEPGSLTLPCVPTPQEAPLTREEGSPWNSRYGLHYLGKKAFETVPPSQGL